MTVHTHPRRKTDAYAGPPTRHRVCHPRRPRLDGRRSPQALALTAGVFPGATEAVVTGSLLIGFAVGWATLAFVSARRTSQPQRWAWVPAVAMSATGAALIAFPPDDSSLSALNWVWPPFMLALVAWMFVQSRRALPTEPMAVDPCVRRTRLGVASGPACQDVTSSRVSDEYPPPGETYSMAGHRSTRLPR